MKRSNWVLLVLLAIAVGTYFLVKDLGEKKAAEATPTAAASTSYLVQETDTILQTVRIYDHDYHIVEMARDQAGLWTVSLPTVSAADQSLAGEAESQIGSLRIVSDLGAVSNLADFGLLAPAYTVKLGYANGVRHKIEVGNLTPTSSGYYVQFDDGAVYVISQYNLDPILNLITRPPYPPTPVPEAATPSS